MKTQKINTISFAKEVIKKELDSLIFLPDAINDSFDELITHICNNQGRLIISGIGKSAIIAQKIVATLNSTGTVSVFMHAADAIHGDLGLIEKNDTVILISKSGTTPEILALIPFIKIRENCLVSIVSNVESPLAKSSNFVLWAKMDREACPNNLAPTTSTTAQLILGDALAMTLQKVKNFSKENFAFNHPGGALGKMLYTTIEDILEKYKTAPKVGLETTFAGVIESITSSRVGATVVLDDKHSIMGIITDGDIRRLFMVRREDLGDLKALDFKNKTVKELFSFSEKRKPKSIKASLLAKEALEIMEINKISQLIVLSDKGEYKGLLHIHDILREGIVV